MNYCIFFRYTHTVHLIFSELNECRLIKIDGTKIKNSDGSEREVARGCIIIALEPADVPPVSDREWYLLGGHVSLIL